MPFKDSFPRKEPVHKLKAGTNTFATIDKKEAGPFYIVNIVDGVATLQGKESIKVPVSDLIQHFRAKPSKAPVVN